MASGQTKPEKWQVKLKEKYLEVLISYFDNIIKDVSRSVPAPRTRTRLARMSGTLLSHDRVSLGYVFIAYNLADQKMFTSISNMDNGSLAKFFEHYIREESHRVPELINATDPHVLHQRIVKKRLLKPRREKPLMLENPAVK
jgi:hypothetical protein